MYGYHFVISSSSRVYIHDITRPETRETVAKVCMFVRRLRLIRQSRAIPAGYPLIWRERHIRISGRGSSSSSLARVRSPPSAKRFHVGFSSVFWACYHTIIIIEYDGDIFFIIIILLIHQTLRDKDHNNNILPLLSINYYGILQNRMTLLLCESRWIYTCTQNRRRSARQILQRERGKKARRNEWNLNWKF